MKKIFTLIVVALMATMYVDAQTLVEGQDFCWKQVKKTMTTVPEDFCEGVSEAQATTKADNEWGSTIYGNLPEEGGAFSVIEYNWISSSPTTKTWAEIIAAVADYDTYYYPAKMDRPEGAPVLGVDFEWVKLNSNYTTAPADMCSGVIEYDAQTQLNVNWGTGALFGAVPEEGGNYTVLYDDWGSVVVKEMSWDQIYTLAIDPWEEIYYPKSLTTTSINNIRNTETKVSKSIKDGQIIIEKNGKTYNIMGVAK